MRRLLVVLAALVAGCGGDDDAPPGGDGGGGVDAPPGARPDAPPGTGATLSDDYPGDVGICADPAVVWCEDFEAASVADVTARYDQVQGMSGMQLVSDQPADSGGTSALAMASDTGVAVDLYKMLPDHEELWVRWYAKYQQGVNWHHSGMWFGGYNPAMSYPSPQAGISPDGDDRFSISIEPMFDNDSRFDFYNYWRGMHSWMPEPFPPDNGTNYYGNSLVHQNAFTVDAGQWVCLEVHVRLNPAPDSAAGALLEVWKNDALVERFDDSGPIGYWVRDKFCPESADGSECTDYQIPATEVLDLQLRTTTDLALNAFWPQNYDPDQPATVWFDQMVVATTRVGCLR